jgi:hypothetical protein
LKNLAILALVLLVIFLGYRIFDLGVTMTYSSDAIERQRKVILIISKYQGKDCDEVIGSEQLKDDLFLKDGKVVIEGVEFECKRETSGRGLLFSIVEND